MHSALSLGITYFDAIHRHLYASVCSFIIIAMHSILSSFLYGVSSVSSRKNDGALYIDSFRAAFLLVNACCLCFALSLAAANNRVCFSALLIFSCLSL